MYTSTYSLLLPRKIGKILKFLLCIMFLSVWPIWWQSSEHPKLANLAQPFNICMAASEDSLNHLEDKNKLCRPLRKWIADYQKWSFFKSIAGSILYSPPEPNNWYAYVPVHSSNRSQTTIQTKYFTQHHTPVNSPQLQIVPYCGAINEAIIICDRSFFENSRPGSHACAFANGSNILWKGSGLIPGSIS